MHSKSSLAIELSKLQTFNRPSQDTEQYATDAEAAATLLWAAYMNNDIAGREVADLGAGTGILGIGALMLGAKNVYLVEQDADAVEVLKENLHYKNASIIQGDISVFSKPVDTVIQNPPFGTVKRHADRNFLLHAFKITAKVYSMHKTSTRGFLQGFAGRQGFAMAVLEHAKLPLKKTYAHHKSSIRRIDIDIALFSRQAAAGQTI